MPQSRTLAGLPVLNAIAFFATVAVNGLAGSTSVLNGRNTGQVSDLYPSLITPAGFTFSIWGMIYALLLVFVVFQFLPSQRQKPFLGQIVGFLFALSCVLNIAWLFLWQYDYIALSVVPMFGLLSTLIAIYLRLKISSSTVSLKERLAFHVPFSVYLGWITVASIADVAAALVSVNWDGFGLSGTVWSILVIVVALVITLAVLATRRDLAYCAVILWALIGIIAKHGDNTSIATTAEVSAIVIVASLVSVLLLARMRK